MKIYTRTGDDGTTGLFSGARVEKISARIEAHGSIDELNSALGVARAGRLLEQFVFLPQHVEVGRKRLLPPSQLRRLGLECLLELGVLREPRGLLFADARALL